MSLIPKSVEDRLINLYFGSNQPKDEAEFKRSTLAGHLSLFFILISLFYIAFEWSIGIRWYISFYVILIITSISALCFLRLGLVKLGKFFLIIPGTLLVSALSAFENYQTGVYMYFSVACLGAFVVFGYEQRRLAMLACAFIVVAFLVSFFIGIEIIDHFETSESYKQRRITLNFFISVTITIVMVYYLMRINWMSEKEMGRFTHELSESRKQFELAIKGSSAGIWDWNAPEKTIFLSPRINQMFDKNGLGNAELVSENWILENLHKDDQDLFTKTLNDHIFEGKPFALECRFRNKQGGYTWVYDTGQAEYTSDGKIIRMVGTVLDITERKEAEVKLSEQRDMLQKTNDELDRFVYSTSHDLRAPLSSILGLIGVAKHSSSVDELKNFLFLIKDRVDALNNFIDEIIDYSRNSRLDVKQEEIKLHSFIDDIISNLKYFENYEKITFINRVDLGFVLVTDSARFKVICNNLITNAVKYHDMQKPNPSITIQSFTDDEYNWFELFDNGPGIERELQEKVFEMFFRASEKSNGSGLGLYIVKEMVDKIGARVDMSSQLGGGTKFTIAIPHSNS